ncbi:MAG: tetratricopeptide repeat protein, partial [Coleofasciculus sp. S288]|nr:tetratricopeptide repeat protein [Coleofasciculus sp. S288]
MTALVYVPVTNAIAPPVTNQVSANPQTLLRQGKAFYDAGQFAEAVTVLQQAADAFKAQGNQLQQAIALTNLALAYQQLGQWSEAQDAITSSLQLLQNANKTDPLKVKGAALDVQGQLYLAQGQPESALESFSLAATTYAQAGDDSGVIRSHINQAQALQANGFYRRALDALQEVRETLHSLPDSSLKATGLRSLGNALRLVGSLDESEDVLKESLAVAQRYGATRQAAPTQSFQDTSAALLSLGNTARAKADIPAALNYYQQAAAVPTSLTTKVQAQLNQLSLLVEVGQFLDAQRLSSEIQPLMAELPTSRASVEARINFARTLMKLRDREDVQTFHQSVSRASLVAQQLSTAVQQAQIIQDPRAESYAL